MSADVVRVISAILSIILAMLLYKVMRLIYTEDSTLGESNKTGRFCICLSLSIFLITAVALNIDNIGTGWTPFLAINLGAIGVALYGIWNTFDLTNPRI